jgi:DNA topoisomerase-1
MKKNKTLILVESPTKIKTISKYLGENYIIRASYGHIAEILDGNQYGIGVDINNNFSMKYRIIPSKKDKLQAIIDSVAEASSILIASDFDREGEQIASDLATFLQSSGVPIKRMILKEITKKAITESLTKLCDIDAKIVSAQNARRALDRIVGYQVSPFIIEILGKNLSAGRVQSAALKLCVDKEREIEAFKPEEYWTIITNLAKSTSLSDKFQAKYTNRITDKITAEKVKKELDSSEYIVTAIEQEEKKKKAPPPLITTTLMAAANSRYKFPAEKTMKIAQMLYETGMITYMRTDSPRLPPESIASCREYLIKNSYSVPAQPNQFSNKNDSQDGHPAIQPTDICKLPANVFLSDDEQKVYKLIWDRFTASQMNPSVFDTVSITIKASENGHTLKANGKTLKSKGWLEIVNDFDNDDHETKLPIKSRRQINFSFAKSKM